MPLRVNCPACKAPNSIDDAMRGRKVRCESCDKVFMAPASAGAKKKRDDEEAIQEDRKVKVKSGGTRKYDEDDDRPIKKKSKAAKGGSATMLVVGGVMAALLLCVLGVGGIGSIWLLRSEPKQAAVAVAVANVDPINAGDIQNQNADPAPIAPRPPEPKPEPINPDLGKPLPDQMAPDVVKKVMDSTVYLRVTMPGGQVAEGSGFFVFEPGIIVTNAHVLGMLRSNSKPPNQVDVVAHSGETNELKMVGQVLGVDRDCDLAVVRVPTNVKLPTPLMLGDDKQLANLQKVYILGFPFGEKLGKNITVSSSAISSLRKDPKTGVLEQIQVNGGMNPGNSGGPVVNSFGNLVGVSVSIITGTQINFAIPSDKVRAIMEGRLAGSRWGEAYAKAGQPRLPVKFECLDPLNRIREMRVEVWTGAPGQVRPNSTEQPKPQPGESPRQSHAVVYREGAGSVEVPLPPLQAGHVYWLQPIITTANGTRWGPAEPATGQFAVLERKPANLMVDLSPQKERTAKMTSVVTNTLAIGKRTKVTVENTVAELLEVVQPSEMKGPIQTTQIKSAYGDLTIAITVDGKKIVIPDYPGAVMAMRGMPPTFVVDSTNAIASYITVTLKPNNPLRDLVTDLNGMVHNAFEATTFKMPNRVVQPMEAFPVRSSMMFRSNAPKVPGQKATIVDLMLNCTYEGMRKRNGREEAILTAVGSLEGRDKLKGRVKGDITGKIGFDVAAGFISYASISITTDTEEQIPGLGSIAETTVQEIQIDRSAGNSLNLQLAKDKGKGTTPTPPPPKTAFPPPSPSPAKGPIVFAQNSILTPSDPAGKKVFLTKLQANVTYVLSMNSAAFDTFLRLENAAGMEVASDDDSGGGLNARIIYRPTQSGVYRVIATSILGAGVGPFQLVVQELEPAKGTPKGAAKENATDVPPVPLNNATFPKPAKSAAPTSYLKVVSAPGDFIGQGKTYDYPGDKVIAMRTPRGVRLAVDGWNVDIGAPTGQFLQVGEYQDAKRFAFSGKSPGLNFSGKGKGANNVSGEFVVWEIEMNGAQIVRLAIDFVQRADGKNAPLQGKLRINSTLQ